MKYYKLKKLPLYGPTNFSNIGDLQKRVEDLELVINALQYLVFLYEEAPSKRLSALIEEVPL